LLTRDETVTLREKRKQTTWEVAPPPPPFLNDILIHGPKDPLDDEESIPECPLPQLLWEHENKDGVLYLPSSPLRRDIAIAMTWLHQQAKRSNPYPWIRRMTWLLDGMSQQMPDLTDIVLDLPPTLVGFSYEVLALFSYLMRGEALPPGFPAWQQTTIRWLARPILVTTPDRNDLYSAMDYILDHRTKLPDLVPLVNRRTLGMETLKEWLDRRYGAATGAAGMLERSVGELQRTLGSMFREHGDLRLNDEVRALATALGVESATDIHERGTDDLENNP
jgi:hypothetical protein